MKKAAVAFILAAAVVLCLPAASAAQNRPTRPRIGLVLSGGGAKGAAHIGVLKVLEQYDIPVDCIVGTSMGAIIGGLYAMGYKADEIDSIISAQDWDFVMSDRIPREDSSFEDKSYDSRYIAKVPFSTGRRLKKPDEQIIGPLPETKQQGKTVFDRIPMAMVNGQNIYNLFTSLSVGYQDSIDFNRMPIPFACVAVDVVGRKEVVWRNGNIVDAIRSSMAIPGYFAPVRIGDMVLIDGGARNNFPVDVARSFGADIIIGVKLGKEEESRGHEVNNISDMISGIYDMYAHEKYEAAMNDTDILIRPSVKGYSTMSFDKASINALIENGRIAAIEKAPELRKLREHLNNCENELPNAMIGPVFNRKQYKKAVHLDKDSILLGTVTYNGLNERDAQLIFKNSLLREGYSVTGKDIDKEISRFYNTAAFESVTYSLRGKEEPYNMVIDFVPGHNSELGLAFRVDNEEASVIQVNTSINKYALYGSSLSITGKLAINPMISVKYSYSFPNKWRLSTEYRYRLSNPRVLHDDLLNSISFSNNILRLSASTRGFRNIQTEGGVEFSNFIYGNFAMTHLTEALSSYNLDLSRRNFPGAYVKLKVNSLDDEFFPTKGWTADGGLRYYIDGYDFPDLNGFAAINLHYSQALSIGRRFTLIPSIDHRSLMGGNIPLAYMNTMGGAIAGRYMDQQIQFIGFNNAVACGKVLTVGNLDARLRLWKKHYITASAAYALEDDHIFDSVLHPGTIGARAGYSYRSAVGPISFYLNWSDQTNKIGFYASFGYSF